ncbi:MAG: carbohydrate kinase family protein [Verrucomicrobia bacterium]|nr:carbohydrate kinase family protein [Verrucomicrobiota bacterium]
MTDNNTRFDVLAASDMCVDLALQGNIRPQFSQVEQLIEDYHLDLGGSANIFAAQVAKLGGSAGVIGYVGQDVFGEFARAQLAANGICTDHVHTLPDSKTGLGTHLMESDDRAILTYPGTIDSLSPADMDMALLDSTRHWHIASYFLLTRLLAFWPEWVRAAKARSVTVSLDTNWDPAGRWEGVLDLLPMVDVFLPNEAEACAICKTDDARDAGERLSKLGPLTVIKMGERGACAFVRGKALHMPMPDGDDVTVVDSIGAGDSFDGGFLYAWLQNQDVETCLRAGIRCGRANVQGKGGFESQLRSLTT